MNKLKRIISSFLALSICIGLSPPSLYANETSEVYETEASAETALDGNAIDSTTTETPSGDSGEATVGDYFTADNYNKWHELSVEVELYPVDKLTETFNEQEYGFFTFPMGDGQIGTYCVVMGDEVFPTVIKKYTSDYGEKGPYKLIWLYETMPGVGVEYQMGNLAYFEDFTDSDKKNEIINADVASSGRVAALNGRMFYWYGNPVASVTEERVQLSDTELAKLDAGQRDVIKFQGGVPVKYDYQDLSSAGDSGTFSLSAALKIYRNNVANDRVGNEGWEGQSTRNTPDKVNFQYTLSGYSSNVKVNFKNRSNPGITVWVFDQNAINESKYKLGTLIKTSKTSSGLEEEWFAPRYYMNKYGEAAAGYTFPYDISPTGTSSNTHDDGLRRHIFLQLDRCHIHPSPDVLSGWGVMFCRWQNNAPTPSGVGQVPFPFDPTMKVKKKRHPGSYIMLSHPGRKRPRTA